jgi:hypothetical protein
MQSDEIAFAQKVYFSLWTVREKGKKNKFQNFWDIDEGRDDLTIVILTICEFKCSSYIPLFYLNIKII